MRYHYITCTATEFYPPHLRAEAKELPQDEFDRLERKYWDDHVGRP